MTNTKPYGIWDAELELKAAGSAITSDGYVGNIIDFGGDSLGNSVGAGEAYEKGRMIVDISAIKITANDELYEFVLMGSDDAAFSGTEEELARFHVGAMETIIGTDVDSTIGRYVTPYTNERNGRYYRYAKLYVDVGASSSPSISFSAHLTK